MLHVLLVFLDSLWSALYPGGMLALSISLRLAAWIEPGWRIPASITLRDVSPLR